MVTVSERMKGREESQLKIKQDRKAIYISKNVRTGMVQPKSLLWKVFNLDLTYLNFFTWSTSIISYCMPVAGRICESRSWVVQHVFHQSIGERAVVGVQHGCSSSGIRENLESWHSPHATKSEGVSVSSVHWVGLETEDRSFLCFVPFYCCPSQ